MKNKKMNALSFLLVGILLFIMYGTSIGIPGITQYWSDFKLFDMQLLYSVDTYRNTIGNIGRDGVRHYLYYFIVDFGFISALFWAQYRVMKTMVKPKKKQYTILMTLVVARGILDLTEDLLLTLVMKEMISDKVIPFVSYITLLKLLCLVVWAILTVTYAVVIRKKSGKIVD